MYILRNFPERVFHPETGEPISSTQYAMQFEGQDDVYMSFTSVEKMGINPKSKFDTPLGIYAYPLNPYLETVEDETQKIGSLVPFAGNNPYVTFIRRNDKYNMLTSDTVSEGMMVDTQSELERYLNRVLPEKDKSTIATGLEDVSEKFKGIPHPTMTQLLNALYLDNIKDFSTLVIEEFDRIAIEWASYFNEGYVSAYIMAMTHYTAYLLAGQRKPAVVWNSILKNVLNIGMIEDSEGEGFIHSNEPLQAFFTTTRAFEVIDRIENKGYNTHWITQATIEGAEFKIVEDFYIIWEGGIWLNGNWKGGVWKNGIWENGVWENGHWMYGTWENGVWEDGTWKKGTWKKGTWKGGTWNDGNWEQGNWLHGRWEDGTWEDGTWIDGNWKGGTWEGGIWKDGIWENGKWKMGIWVNGIWGSGTWVNGEWENGTWKEGFIYSEKFKKNLKSYISPKEFYSLEKQSSTIEELESAIKE